MSSMNSKISTEDKMKSKLSLKIAVVAAALFVIAICSSRVTYAAPPKDACSLLTPAQVTAVLGFSAKPGRFIKSDTTVCDWPLPSLAKATSKGTKIIEVALLSPDSWAMLAPALSAMTKLPGVGDYAAYGGPDNTMTLYVKKGKAVFRVTVGGFPLDQVKAKEKTLAQDILAKL